MGNNKGKQFEQLIREAFERVPEVSVDRIPDQTMRYKGANNICDFIVYKYPFEFYIECKSVHGNTLPFSNIKQNQWEGLLEKADIEGVYAGVICWWVDKDITKFIPIRMLQSMREQEGKSIRYDIIACNGYEPVEIAGKKKRVFFEYDMESFFEEVVK